jgi:selenoprotein W-related protein
MSPARFIPAVAVFVFRGDRLLAMRRSRSKDAAPGAWEALSGRVEPGEQPPAAALREAREESGLVVHLEARPVAAYQAKRNRDDMLVVAYRADAPAGDVALSNEHDAYAWMTLDEFAAACPFPPLVEAARRAAAAGAEAASAAPGAATGAGTAGPGEGPAPAKPRVEIEYCTQCRWMLRAAWYAQELLTTFQEELGGVTLVPGSGGVFNVRAGGATVWTRAPGGGFPEIKELKRLVRDRIAPGKDLGHSERRTTGA